MDMAPIGPHEHADGAKARRETQEIPCGVAQCRQVPASVEQFAGARVVPRVFGARRLSGGPEHHEPMTAARTLADQGCEMVQGPAVLVFSGADVKAYGLFIAAGRQDGVDRYGVRALAVEDDMAWAPGAPAADLGVAVKADRRRSHGGRDMDMAPIGPHEHTDGGKAGRETQKIVRGIAQRRQVPALVEQIASARVVPRMFGARRLAGGPEHHEPMAAARTLADQSREAVQGPALLVFAGTDVKADGLIVAAACQLLAGVRDRLRGQHQMRCGRRAGNIQRAQQPVDPLDFVKRLVRVPIQDLLRDAGEPGQGAHLGAQAAAGVQGRPVALLAQPGDKPKPVTHERSHPSIRSVLGLGVDMYAIDVGISVEQRGVVGVDERADVGIGVAAPDPLEYGQSAYEVADIIPTDDENARRLARRSGGGVRWQRHPDSVSELGAAARVSEN